MSKRPKGIMVGERIVLKPMRKKDHLESCLEWINDSEIRQYLSVIYPISEIEEEKWFERQHDDEKNIIFAIELHDGTFIGVIGLHNIDYISRSCITGTLIGNSEYHNKGFGTEAKMLLLEYGFNHLNLRKIKSAAIAFNGRSVRYSEKCGYWIEGRLKDEFFRNGEYHDMILLAVDRENWLQAKERLANQA